MAHRPFNLKELIPSSQRTVWTGTLPLDNLPTWDIDSKVSAGRYQVDVSETLGSDATVFDPLPFEQIQGCCRPPRTRTRYTMDPSNNSLSKHVLAFFLSSDKFVDTVQSHLPVFALIHPPPPGLKLGIMLQNLRGALIHKKCLTPASLENWMVWGGRGGRGGVHAKSVLKNYLFFLWYDKGRSLYILNRQMLLILIHTRALINIKKNFRFI